MFESAKTHNLLINLTDEWHARYIDEGPGHQIAKEMGTEQQKKSLMKNSEKPETVY